MNQALQTKIFAAVLENYDNRADAVSDLCLLFNLGADSVYRRMRGQSLLSPDQITLLAKKYNISLDALVFEQSDTVFFNYNAFSKKVTNFKEYLEGVLQNIEAVHALPKSQFYYASMEIPVFHYFLSRELTAFKLYVWGLTSWGFGFLQDRKFDFNMISNDNFKLTNRILELYNNIPTTELYSLNIVDHTLNHIEYIAMIDGFENPKDALVLCDAIQEIMQHSKRMAAVGMKFSPNASPDKEKSAAFNLYHNELVSTNNTFLVKSDLTRMVFTTFGNPNFLSSNDERMCDYSERWLQATIEKSTSMTLRNAKNRTWFFKKIERKIKNTRKRIKMLIKK